MNEQPSGWAVGWTAFAGIMMIMQGVWWVIAGLVAIVDDDFYAVTREYIFKFDTSTWGWIHLLLGIVVLFAGVGLGSHRRRGHRGRRLAGRVRVASVVPGVGDHLHHRVGRHHLGADRPRPRHHGHRLSQEPGLPSRVETDPKAGETGVFSRAWSAPASSEHEGAL